MKTIDATHKRDGAKRNAAVRGIGQQAACVVILVILGGFAGGEAMGQCTPPPPAMQLWLPFDGATGSTVANLRGPAASLVGSANITTFGKVGNSVWLDGSDDHVAVPHYYSVPFASSHGRGIDIRQNDFSIDAWIQREGLAGVRVIVDKRAEVGGLITGYSFYLYDGRLGLQLACGAGGYSGWNLPVAEAIPISGDFYHVAVTVDRDNPAGLVFYINGQPKGTFNPTGYQGSLENTSELWVGDRTAAPQGGACYAGAIDELEIFNRVLTPAEILAIYQADTHGKCRTVIDETVMAGPTNLPAGLTKSIGVIINTGEEDKSYEWALHSSSGGDLPGPSAFSPDSGSVTLTSGQCTGVGTTITLPSGMTPGLTSLYDLVVYPQGAPVTIDGDTLCIDSAWYPVFSSGFVAAVTDTTVNLGKLSVHNISGAPALFDYRIVAGLVDGDTLCIDSTFYPPAVALNDLTPGEPIYGSATISSPDTLEIWLTGRFVDYRLLDRCRVALQRRAGFGWKTLASMFFINVPQMPSCCVGNRGNVNGDVNDAVGVSDLTYLVNFLFRGGPKPPCPEEANVNADAATLPNISDLTYLVNFLFKSGAIPRPCAAAAGASAGKMRSDIILSTTYDESGTVIAISSPIDLRGLQVELSGSGCREIVNLGDPGLDIIHGTPAPAFSLGLLDLQGDAVIRSGRRDLIRLDGQYAIVDAVVSDLDHVSIIPSLTGSASPHVPRTYELRQNYPNPFNPTTEISYSLPNAGHIRLDVYNVIGQQVAVLVDEWNDAGDHTLRWDASRQASGVYFYRLIVDNQVLTRKMLLMK